MILSHHRRKRSRRVLTPGQQVAAVIAVDKEAGGWVFRPAVGDTTTGGARWAGASLRRAGFRRVPASTRARPVRSPLEAQMVAVAASILATVYAPPGGADGGLTVWPPPGHCGRRAAAAAGPLRLPGYRRAGESVVTVDAPSQPPLRRRPPRSLAHASLKPAAATSARQQRQPHRGCACLCRCGAGVVLDVLRPSGCPTSLDEDCSSLLRRRLGWSLGRQT